MDGVALNAAISVLRRHEARLMSIPGVFGAGVGSAADHGGADEPCIVVRATDGLTPGAVPAELDGVPVFVVIGPPPQQQT
jgi:hypothetical protein